jgi:hypothetical protein
MLLGAARALVAVISVAAKGDIAGLLESAGVSEEGPA